MYTSVSVYGLSGVRVGVWSCRCSARRGFANATWDAARGVPAAGRRVPARGPRVRPSALAACPQLEDTACRHTLTVCLVSRTKGHRADTNVVATLASRAERREPGTARPARKERTAHAESDELSAPAHRRSIQAAPRPQCCATYSNSCTAKGWNCGASAEVAKMESSKMALLSRGCPFRERSADGSRASR